MFFSTPLATEWISDYYIFPSGSPWITAFYLLRSFKISEIGSFTQRDVFYFSVCSTSTYSSFSVHLEAIAGESDLNTSIFTHMAAGSHVRLQDLYWEVIISYSFNIVWSLENLNRCWRTSIIISHVVWSIRGSHANCAAALHAFLALGSLCPGMASSLSCPSSWLRKQHMACFYSLWRNQGRSIF